MFLTEDKSWWGKNTDQISVRDL